MIEFYKAGTIEFNGGTKLKNVYDSVITHERNGRFDVVFKYPLTDAKYKEFETHDLFYMNVPYMGKQAFYLSDITKKINHVEVYAKHIFFMLGKNVIADLHTLTNGDTCQLILDKFKNQLQIPNHFNFKSDITNRHIFNKPHYNNALEVLVDGKHSILGQWGGVIIMDNWTVRINERWGRDTEYLVAKRKNISDIEIKDTGENITTRLYLKTEVDDEIIMATVDSPLINNYPEVYGEVRETTDESVKTQQDLIDYGERIFKNQRIDLPKETFEFDVTDDVKEYEFTIDDTALIYYSDYDIYKRITISSYEYDPIQDRYLKITFGDKAKSMVQQVTDKVDRDLVTPTFNTLDEIISEIVSELDNPTGGIVRFVKDQDGNINEILILDNENLELAKDIWRLNIQGISHSNNGVNGDFNVAMTQNGEIVADFIATGTLNASLIKAGILHSLTGNTWIDMETGHFNFADRIINNENGFEITLSSGKTIEEELLEIETVKGLITVDLGKVKEEYRTFITLIRILSKEDSIDTENETKMTDFQLLLSTEMNRVNRSYNALINNIHLTDPLKEEFINSKWTIDNNYQQLNSKINSLLVSNTITEDDVISITSLLTTFGTSLDNYLEKDSEVRLFIQKQVDEVVDNLGENQILRSATEPENPKDGMLWLDLSAEPPRLYIWNQLESYWDRTGLGEDAFDNNFTDLENRMLAELASERDDLIEDYDNKISESAGQVKSEIGEQLNTVTGPLAERIKEQEDKAEENEDLLHEIRMNFAFDEGGFGIGKVGSPFSINIDNSQMLFLYRDKVMASINHREMKITNLDISDKIKIGVHEIEKYSEDITLIKHIGGN